MHEDFSVVVEPVSAHCDWFEELHKILTAERCWPSLALLHFFVGILEGLNYHNLAQVAILLGISILKLDDKASGNSASAQNLVHCLIESF